MDITQGLIVKSKAGRDNGKLFIVLQTENEFAYIADGVLRNSDRPKKKKLKHLQPTNYCSQPIKDKLLSNGFVTNSELRNALAEYLK